MNALNLGVPLRPLREMQRQSDHDGAARQQDRCRYSPPSDAAEDTKQIQRQRQTQFWSIWLGNRQERG